MIGVAGQSKPRLLSRSSRPAAAAFRIDQDARCAEMSESGTFETCRPAVTESASGGRLEVMGRPSKWPRMTQSRRWMFGRILGLDGRESYRELRLEPLYCLHRL